MLQLPLQVEFLLVMSSVEDRHGKLVSPFANSMLGRRKTVHGRQTAMPRSEFRDWGNGGAILDDDQETEETRRQWTSGKSLLGDLTRPDC